MTLPGEAIAPETTRQPEGPLAPTAPGAARRVAWEAETEQAAAIQGRSPWQLGFARLRRDRAAMIALGVVIAIALVAILAPVIAALTGHGPNVQYPPPIGQTVDGLPEGPSAQFLLGTDDLGRDVLVRDRLRGAGLVARRRARHAAHRHHRGARRDG